MNAWMKVEVARTEAGTLAIFSAGGRTYRLAVAREDVREDPRGTRLRVWLVEHRGDDAVIVVDGPGAEGGRRLTVPGSLIVAEPSHVESNRLGWVLLSFIVVSVVMVACVLLVLHVLHGPGRRSP